MVRKVFINLPVADLERSVSFFTQLGFAFDKRFTDDSATCMVVSEQVMVMLLSRERFQRFTPKSICDASKSSEVLICLSLDSRAEVDAMVLKAVAAGGGTYTEPQEHGFMYGHGFQDPDGHIWEVIHMPS